MAQTGKHTLTVQASTQYLSDVRAFVADCAHNAGFQSSDVEDIRLAVDEAFTNIVEHAYNYDTSKEVCLSTGFNKNKFWISISDEGKPYDPTSYKEPNIPERIKQGKGGGVGVYLIKKLMDHVEYKTIGNINQIRMSKSL